MASGSAVQVEILASFGQYQAGLMQASQAMRDMVQGMKGAMGDVPSAVKPANEAMGGLFDKMKQLRGEQVQQGRMARFYASELSSIIPASVGAKGAIEGLASLLIEGAAGGLSFGLAFEAAKTGIGIFTEATKKAEEQATKTKEALKKMREEVDGIGKSALQIDIGKAVKFRGALNEYYAANAAFGDSGKHPGSESPEEIRLDKATKALRELATAAGIVDGKLASAEALASLLGEKVAATETSEAVKTLTASEKALAEARAEAYMAGEFPGLKVDQKHIDAQQGIVNQRLAEERERAAAAAGAGSVGDFAAMESSSFGVDSMQEAAQLKADAAFKKSMEERKRLMTDLTTAGQRMGNEIGTAFAKMVTGSMSVGQAMATMAKAILSSLIDMVLKVVMANAVNAASGAAASQAGIPVVGPILAAAAMASMLAMVQGLVSSIPARAMGGWVDSGQTYLVGERGPELFRASSSGTIIPNHQLGGAGGGMSTTINISAFDNQSIERGLTRSDSQLMRALRKAQRRIG